MPTQSESTGSARPLLGYLRVSLSMSDREIEHLRDKLAVFARRERFELCRVFVDRSPLHTAGFASLISALQRREAGHVVVPALHHFAHVPSVQLAMRDLLESQTGARVLVMYPSTGALA